MCRNCGALVGASETQCSVCGAPKDSAVKTQTQSPSHVYDGETIRFARAILTRPYIFTIVFLVANVFIFLLMWSSSGLDSATLWEPPFPVLIAYGAKLNYLIKDNHEWWRFVTPVFIHIGLAHLLVNMYGLWMIGPYVERLYGSAKFVVLYVATGIVGVVASYFCVRPGLAVGPVGRFLFRAADGPAAGASGALFGLVGVLFVFGIKFRRELPEGFKRAFGTGLVPIILLNLFIGYIGRGFIDNAAHLGGLLSGALFALAINYKRPNERTSVAISWRVLQILALALVVVSFVMVVRHFPKQLPKSNEGTTALPPSLSVEGRSFAANLDAVNAAQTTLLNSLKNNDASGIDEAVQTLDQAPRLDAETDALRNDLKSLLARAKAFVAAAPSKGQPTKARVTEEGKLLKDFQTWQEGYGKWTETESKRYGVELIKKSQPEQDSKPEK